VAGSALYVHEALVLATAGDRMNAEKALARVRASDLSADPTLADAARVARQLLARAR
jgi:hypothetical protein